jgi:DNA-binding transcriptional ArsR family regulator
VAAKPKFTRIPKVNDLVYQGVPTEVIPTYCSLADYANNKTGLCWPKMETLAQTLNRSVRTIQRHLHLLKELGLIEFVQRQRNKGRYSSYLYRVLHIAQTTGHGRRVEKHGSNSKRTKRVVRPSYNPPEGAYNWFFGLPPDHEAEKELERQREEEAKRRIEGYEWFFNQE